MTQSAWDEGRAGAGHPDAPTARAIVQRLGVAWSRLLQIAHGGPDDALRALGNAAADKGRKGHTLPRAATALRQAALRLDKPGVTRGDYRKARGQIIAAARRAGRSASVTRALPDLTQMETVLGQNNMSWEDGLVFAGLQLPERVENQGLDERAAARAFVEDLGKLPRSAKQLKGWAHSRKLSIRHPRRALLDDAVAEIQRERAAARQPDLEVADRGEHQVAPAGPAAANGRPARAAEWNKPEIIAGLARAIRILGAGKQLTQRALKEVAEANPGRGIPSWSSVDRRRRTHHPEETWQEWVAEAAALARTPREL